MKIPGSNVYVYQHKDHVQASGVELASFGQVCEEEIAETVKPVIDCGEERGHDDDLQPFCHSNSELLEIYKIMSSDEEPPKRKARVLIYLNSVNLVEAGGDLRCNDDRRRFHTDYNHYIYSKDTWTK